MTGPAAAEMFFSVCAFARLNQAAVFLRASASLVRRGV